MTAAPALPRQLEGPALAGASALDRLRARPWEFDFFQAVWMLDRYEETGGTPVGLRGPVAQERLRFRPSVSMAFPATDVCGLWPVESGGSPFELLEVAFLGLYGASTPLPLHYAVSVLRATDQAARPEERERRAREGDAGVPESSPVRDFLDIAHHRLISLFYRAWVKYHYERQYAAPQRDVITEYLKLLIGCAYDEATLGVPPTRLLRYAGVLTQRPRSARTLGGVLSDYWHGLNVRVEQFVGKWVTLHPADLNCLGKRNSGLGTDLTVGDQVYDLGGAFVVVFGPVDWEIYQTFLPGGPRYEQSRALVRLYCVDPLSFELEVRLGPNEVPPMHLRSDEGAGRLGWTSWVRSVEMGATSVTFAA